jgi:hypothetical protein
LSHRHNRNSEFKIHIVELASLSYRELHRLQRASADHFHGHGATYAVSAEKRLQVVRIIYRLAVKAYQYVTHQKAACRRRSISVNTDNE